MADTRSFERQGEAGTPLTHNRLIGARLYLHTYIRLILAVSIVFGALFARFLVGIENLDVMSLIGLGVVILGYNTAAWLLTRHHRDLALTLTDYRRLLTIMHGAIVLDFLSLTAAVWLVGGTRSPFLAFYLLHVILSCVLLTQREALTFAALAFTLMMGLVLGEWLGVLPPRQPIGAVAGFGALDGRFAVTVLAVYGMLLAITVFLLSTLTERLRDGERRIRQANAELERLSNLRRDFLHIALHNIQSPIGAVTMYLQNINAGLGGELTEKQGHWVGRSLHRLDGLNEFLQNFRMLNSLESGKIDAQARSVDVVGLLEELVEEHRESASSQGHALILEVPGVVPPVLGIERLLREATVNYITNAIKYTPDGGRIVVRALSRPPLVRIEVEDNGIGISDADQAKLFNEFVRLSRAGTPVAQVAGSGLGLSIVRRVIESHGGRTFVESQVGTGSTFVIELPAAPEAPGAAPARLESPVGAVSSE